jgi:hypothetical protein
LVSLKLNNNVSKDIATRVKTKSTEWENVADCVSCKGLVPRIYKELLEPTHHHHQQQQQPKNTKKIKTWAKDVDTNFFRENTQ